MITFRCHSILVLLAMALATPAAHAQSTAIVQSLEQAIAQDAVEYARHYTVSQADAVERLRALDATVTATDRIRRDYVDRLAGLAIEHQPDLRIVVLLTGDDSVPSLAVTAGALQVSIEFRTGAVATREAIVMAMTVHQAALRSTLLRPPALGLDDRTGEMVVQVANADVHREGLEALQTRVAALVRVPVRVEIAGGTGVNLALVGGARLTGQPDPAGPRYLCTAGFAVADGIRSGVVTAAHCPDGLSHVAGDGIATPLDFIGQWGWGYRDVQIHVAREPVEPLVFADTAKRVARPVTASRPRASTRVGDFVCHRGERTGYSCAEVLITDFAPSGDLCGGDCLPTWVAVAGPACRGGDSGAPVYVGTAALGIVKGGTYRADGSCLMYYYMSVDYLPSPWRLLLKP